MVLNCAKRPILGHFLLGRSRISSSRLRGWDSGSGASETAPLPERGTSSVSRRGSVSTFPLFLSLRAHFALLFFVFIIIFFGLYYSFFHLAQPASLPSRCLPIRGCSLWRFSLHPHVITRLQPSANYDFFFWGGLGFPWRWGDFRDISLEVWPLRRSVTRP